MKTRRLVLALSATFTLCGSLWLTTTHQAKEAKAEPASGYHVPEIVDFACGEYHSLAIDSNGNLWQWGCKTGTQTTPQQIMAGTKFSEVAAGLDYSLALDQDGNTYSWSNYASPTLGENGINSIGVAWSNQSYCSTEGVRLVSYSSSNLGTNPTFLVINSSGFLGYKTSDASGLVFSSTHMDAALALGEKYASDTRYSGYSNHRRFTILYSNGSSGFSIKGIDVNHADGSWNFSMSSPKSGLMYAAGNLLSVSTPEAGTFIDFAITKTIPTAVTGYPTATSTLDSAAGFAVSSDGSAYSFGYNNASTNILGSTDSEDFSGQADVPLRVDLENKARKIDAGNDYAIALCEDGNLYAWGSNAYGQLGLGDTDNRTLPTRIPFFQSNSQYSFVAAKGDTYEGSFAITGMTSYSVDTDPSKGEVVLNESTGAFTYTPDANATGTDYFTIEVSDGVVTKTYIVNVTIDYKPVWQPFEVSFNVRRGESFSASAPATDEDGDSLKYSVVQYPTQGTVEIGETSGTFTYTANDNGAGIDSFKIAVTDGYFTIEKTFNVHVETYVVVDDIYERSFDATSSDVHFASQLVAADDDGDALSWSVIKAPTLGTLDLNTSTGAYTYDSDQGVTGNDSFIIQVTDGVCPIQKEYTVHLYSIKDNGTPLVNVTTTGVPFSSQVLTVAKNTAVSYSVKTQGSFGLTTINAESGEYTYAPNTDTRGQDSFVVAVSHTYGSYELEVFIYQNSIPNDSLVKTSIIVAENGSYSGFVACSDLDLGDTLSYQLKDNPMKGNVDLNATTGAYTYTPLEGLAGNDSFSVKVGDGINEITITVNVHIESAIQTESNVYRTTSQSTAIQGVLTATDKDGDVLSYSLKTSAVNGASSVSADGTYSYTPDVGFYGDDFFVATVTDGAAPVDITIHVHVNRKPIATSDTVSVVAAGSSITGSVSADDPDGDALVYTIFTEPSQGIATVDSGNGKFSYTPNAEAVGDDSFVIKASDGTDYALVTVNVHNETEVVIDASATNLTASQGKTLDGVVVAIDADGDELTYRVVMEPTKGVLSLNSHTGSWSYACNPDAQGEDTFEIAVTDGVKEKNVTFHLNINIPPKISGDSELSFVTNQGAPYIGTVIGTDGDGGALTYSVIAQGQKGSVTIDSSTGQYTYMPNEGAAGDDQFVLGISDGTFVTQVIISAHIESDIALDESVQYVIVDKGGLVVGNVVASDADGDVLSYNVFSEPAKGVATVDSNGVWSFLANGDGAGSDTFVITVTDGTHTKYVTVYVHIDTAPVFDAESQTISVQGNGTVTSSVSATDLDGDQLTYTMDEMPSSGTVNLNSSTGSYTYTNTTKATDDSFKIKVSDTNGNEAVIVVYVKINNAPATQNLALSVHQGESVEGQLIAADGEGDPLVYSVSAQGSKGLASVDAGSGKVIYVANRGASGIDTFEISVSDGFNVVKTTVVVTIQANSAPASSGLNLSTKQGDPVNGSIDASDADGDALSFTLTRAPSNGTASVDSSTGKFVYAPDHDFSGADSFVVRVFDGLDYSEVTVNVSVEKNEAPKPKSENQSYSVAQGNSFSGTIEVNDMEGDNLSFTIADSPKYGAVQIDQKTGSFNYKANPFAAGGTDSFVVEVSDGYNVSRVMVQVSIDSTAMNVGFVSGGVVAYTGVVVAAVLIIGKLRKKGM